MIELQLARGEGFLLLVHLKARAKKSNQLRMWPVSGLTANKCAATFYPRYGPNMSVQGPAIGHWRPY